MTNSETGVERQGNPLQRVLLHKEEENCQQ